MKLYGIPNCDTVKKARAWLTAQGVDYGFHDFKKAGVPEEHLQVWLKAVPWEKLINRQGTMWRKLGDAEREAVVDAPSAAALARAVPSVIKRPVVEWPGGAITVGFDETIWSKNLKR